MSKTFTIEISLCETFTIEEIWPDGNAPADPTASDVLAAFLKDGHHVHRTCADWGLEVRKEDVHITMHDPEELQDEAETRGTT